MAQAVGPWRMPRLAVQRVMLATAVVALFVAPGAAAAQTTLAQIQDLAVHIHTSVDRDLGERRRARGGGAPVVARPPVRVDRRRVGDGAAAERRDGDGGDRAPGGGVLCISCRRSGPGRSIRRPCSRRAHRTGFKAVHSRHELFATPLPGATSSPEQSYGTCEWASDASVTGRTHRVGTRVAFGSSNCWMKPFARVMLRRFCGVSGARRRYSRNCVTASSYLPSSRNSSPRL